MQAAFPDSGPNPGAPRKMYLAVLAGLFTFFNAARVMAYLPTIWLVAASGDSSNHSLWTWAVFLGSNVTMTLWIWEQGGRRCNRIVAVSASNSLMCLGIIAVIVWARL
jgi:hypothetical protein